MIIDILILSEVNINDNIVSMFNINGYRMHSMLRKNRKGGGIILYARDVHSFAPVSHSLIYCETIIGKITTPYKYSAYICAVYRPPSQSKHLFVKEISSLLSNSMFQLCDTYLLGDVNIDLKTCDNIRDYYISSMSECGLTSAISDYTRIEIRGNNTTRSCIDHIFNRTRSLDLYSAALGTVMADHRMIILSCVGFDQTQIQNDTKIIQQINNYKIKNLLNNLDWTEVKDIECPSKIYDCIKNKLNCCYSDSKYIRKINKISKRNKYPWINCRIDNMCKKKNKLFIKWKNDSTDKLIKLEYNKLRNKTRKIIKKSKNKYYIEQINSNKMNLRNLWQILNTLSGRNKNSIDEAILKAFNKNNIDTKSIANNFATEFRNYDKNHVILLFIDFSKAFDTLRHDTLLRKLENTGVRGPILKWCKDYLYNRKYKVKICDEVSDAIDVTEGTAQGSVLGPLHYLAYVNDMEHVVNHCSVYQYADDMCILATSKDLKEAAQRLQQDFTQISKWAHDAGLVLNANKTKIIHVHSNYIKHNTDFKVVAHSHRCLHKSISSRACKCEAIEQVTHHTYLGLIVDNRFSWRFHIDSVCDKLRAILAKFYILKPKV
ncbi:unnamed protein product [Parnassius mnemosyne]|uniref:Reverse transcriptase domain-containing protein n=1 Tax=Parnassius mnemosyne TaxID=213953 RepID=A0AAV1M366_9NEOP